jgi:hemoglobin-like flavoprotein
MDKGGHVRGQMLATAFEALLDGGTRLAGLIDIERMNHVNIGVAQEVFDGFLPLLMETVREALGEAWTAEMERGWARRLGALGISAGGAAPIAAASS